MSIADWIVAEFRALGLSCVAFGPEFWLVVPVAGAVLIAAGVGYFIWRYSK